ESLVRRWSGAERRTYDGLVKKRGSWACCPAVATRYVKSLMRFFCWLILEENVSLSAFPSMFVRCSSDARYSTLLLAVVSSTSLKTTLAEVSSLDDVQKLMSSTIPFTAA